MPRSRARTTTSKREGPLRPLGRGADWRLGLSISDQGERGGHARAVKPIDLQQFTTQNAAELAVSSGRVELVAAGSAKLQYIAKQTGKFDVSDLRQQRCLQRHWHSARRSARPCSEGCASGYDGRRKLQGADGEVGRLTAAVCSTRPFSSIRLIRTRSEGVTAPPLLPEERDGLSGLAPSPRHPCGEAGPRSPPGRWIGGRPACSLRLRLPEASRHQREPAVGGRRRLHVQPGRS